MTSTVTTDVSTSDVDAKTIAPDMAVRNPRSRLESPLIWLMTMALIAGPLAIIQQNAQTSFWQAGVWLFGVVVAWSIFAGRTLINQPTWQRNPLAFRAAEVVFLGLILRIVLWAVAEGFPRVAELQDYLIAPWLVFNGLWVGYMVLTILIWAWTNDLIKLFNRLAMTDFELDFFNMPKNEQRVYRETILLRTDRTTISQFFFSRWMIGGFILIVCAAASTISMGELREEAWFTGLTRLPFPPLLTVSLLVYFFSGFWLLSYSRYTALYARWIVNGTRPHASLAPTWRRNTFMLLGSIGLIAAFIPIGDTTPIATALASIIWVITAITTVIVNFFVLLFVGFLSLFMGPGSSETQEFEPPPPLEMPEFDGGEVVAAEPMSPVVAGTITWGLIGVAIVLALLFLWQQGKLSQLRPMLREFWQRLQFWWQMLRGKIQTQIDEARIFVAEQLGREVPLLPERGKRRLDPNNLSTREQVRYFYLKTIERAQERGLERKTHQTPAEFLADLQDEWPEDSADSELLTDAFLQARYSANQVETEQVGSIKATWQRVRKAFRKQRKKKEAD